MHLKKIQVPQTCFTYIFKPCRVQKLLPFTLCLATALYCQIMFCLLLKTTFGLYSLSFLKLFEIPVESFSLDQFTQMVLHNCLGPPSLLVEGLSPKRATPSSFYLLVELRLPLHVFFFSKHVLRTCWRDKMKTIRMSIQKKI